MKTIEAGSFFLSISDVCAVAREKAKVRLNPEILPKVKESRRTVEFLLKEKVVYGINTGFGKLADTLIPLEKNQELQKNLLLSHAVGVGETFSEEVVRGMLLLRLHSLARGFSGVRPILLERLVDFLNAGIVPVVPSQGSVGSSGDLAPLAHLCLPLIGEGEVFFHGKRMPSAVALKQTAMAPLQLEAKEGLALINGTQAMTAVAALALWDTAKLLDAALVASAMTLEATLSSDTFLDERLHALRPHPGQMYVARTLQKLVKGSKLIASHKDSLHRIQDAYSIRCIPQVHGPVHDAYAYVVNVIETEINAVTDNPLVFSEKNEILSGGNFHGHPISLSLDFLKTALAGLSNISERRIERLVNPNLSEGLPPFLSRDSGIHSGMMILQYTAASLVSENKSLSHPASVDSIPTSANQEDYNSMGTWAARQLSKIVENTMVVIGIELLCATQALDFRRPLTFGEGVEKAYSLLRQKIPPLYEDRM
jgi:histidine ammonia-lyase